MFSYESWHFVKQFVPRVTWYRLLLLPKTVNSWRIKVAFSCGHRAWWGLVRTAWMFSILSTRWCWSAAGRVHVRTQCDSGAVCWGSQLGETNDLRGLGASHPWKRTRLAPWVLHPQQMNESKFWSKAQRIGYVSSFLKYCLLSTWTLKSRLWHSLAMEPGVCH